MSAPLDGHLRVFARSDTYREAVKPDIERMLFEQSRLMGTNKGTAEDSIFRAGVIAGLSKILERFDGLSKDIQEGTNAR